MKGKITPIFLMLCLMHSVIVNAQELKVSGKVTDANGESLPGVSIGIKGSSGGTQSSATGTYSLSVPSAQSILVFSYIGFVGQEIAVNGRTTINITLAEDKTKLQEVVVVGYGTQKLTTVS